jgi:hypothetical protein
VNSSRWTPRHSTHCWWSKWWQKRRVRAPSGGGNRLRSRRRSIREYAVRASVGITSQIHEWLLTVQNGFL